MAETRKKVLVLPSWYPRPDDTINGSFFQEQAKLVGDRFDVKVLFFRFTGRPSLRALRTTPIQTGKEWLWYVFQGKALAQLPDDEVFTNPPLIEYRMRIFDLTGRRRYRQRLNAYLEALAALLATGWRPDLIHAHSVNLGGLVAQRIKEVHGIPYVITEHMPFAIGHYPEFMREEVKRAFRNADQVLSLGYDKVRQLGMADIDVEPNLVFNFVDETVFDQLCSPYVPGQPLKLISIGAASHLKDHRTLLRALAVLKERGVPFSLTLIGLKAWGGLYQETLDLIHHLGLDTDVTVVDRTERAEIRDYLTAHQVYVMTSIAEGFPVSVLEALACGLFVVATRHGGTEDILTPECGAVVEIKNFNKIADRLQAIYLGQLDFEPKAIREYVISVCGTEAFKRRLIGYYERAMEQAE
jgi:glycosyltransferase involved in cell wall biosynthesis